jgi:hypothetical protein
MIWAENCVPCAVVNKDESIGIVYLVYYWGTVDLKDLVILPILTYLDLTWPNLTLSSLSPHLTGGNS